MWPFNKKTNEPIEKNGVKLKCCPLCKSHEVKFYCYSSDYFKYSLKIKCESCNLFQEKYGKTDEEHTPELFKKDWDNFLNLWNDRKEPTCDQ
jgi:hypothetical protein